MTKTCGYTNIVCVAVLQTRPLNQKFVCISGKRISFSVELLLKEGMQILYFKSSPPYKREITMSMSE